MRKFNPPLLLLLLLLCLTMLPVAHGAQVGDYTYQLLEDGTACLTGYQGTDTVIALPETLDGYTITAIAPHAFAGQPIISVTIPVTLTRVPGNPFTLCSQLTEVQVVPGHPTLEVIGGVLYDKTTKTLLCYPGGFYGDSFAVPQGTLHIGMGAFYCAPARLAAITIPRGLLTVGDYAFYGANIEKIVLPRGVTAIGDFAFADGGWDFQEVQISSTVATMGRNPFFRSKFLETIKVVKENRAFFVHKDGMLYDRRTQTMIAYPPSRQESAYTVPNHILHIGPYAFSGNPYLQQVTLPPGIQSVDDSAFDGTMVHVP